MSDTRCSDCGTVVDQSDACTHVCPPDPVRERIEILEAQVRSLQMAAPRGIPEASGPMPCAAPSESEDVAWARDFIGRIEGMYEEWAGLPDPRRQTIYAWDSLTAREMFLDAWNEFGGEAALCVGAEEKKT